MTVTPPLFASVRRAVAGLLTAASCGCSGIRLEPPLPTHIDDWPSFGANAARTSATSHSVLPPLTREWEYDPTGGIGNGSPLAFDSAVFIGNLRGELHAIHVRTGKRIGWINVGEAIQGAPAIDGSLVVIAATNTKESLTAFDLVDGKVRWKISFGDIEVTPLLFNRRIFFGTMTGMFYCLERDNGGVAWTFEIPENVRRKAIRSSSAAEDSTVVFGADDGAFYALDTKTGRLRWTVQAGASVVAAPSIAEGTVYGVTIAGVVYALDLVSGAEKWKHDAGSAVFGSTTVVDGKVIVGTTGGYVLALRAADGTPVWKSLIGGPVNTAAAASGSTLYVGTLKKALCALQLSDGTVVWKEDLGGRIKTSPAVAYGRVFVATDDRLLVSLKGSTR